MNQTIVCDNRPGDPARFADRKFGAMDIAREFAINLHFAVADDIAGYLHPGTQDRRCAG